MNYYIIFYQNYLRNSFQDKIIGNYRQHKCVEILNILD